MRQQNDLIARIKSKDHGIHSSKLCPCQCRDWEPYIDLQVGYVSLEGWMVGKKFGHMVRDHITWVASYDIDQALAPTHMALGQLTLLL